MIHQPRGKQCRRANRGAIQVASDDGTGIRAAHRAARGDEAECATIRAGQIHDLHPRIVGRGDTARDFDEVAAFKSDRGEILNGRLARGGGAEEPEVAAAEGDVRRGGEARLGGAGSVGVVVQQQACGGTCHIRKPGVHHVDRAGQRLLRPGRGNIVGTRELQRAEHIHLARIGDVIHVGRRAGDLEDAALVHRRAARVGVADSAQEHRAVQPRGGADDVLRDVPDLHRADIGREQVAGNREHAALGIIHPETQDAIRIRRERAADGRGPVRAEPELAIASGVRADIRHVHRVRDGDAIRAQDGSEDRAGSHAAGERADHEVRAEIEDAETIGTRRSVHRAGGRLGNIRKCDECGLDGEHGGTGERVPVVEAKHGTGCDIDGTRPKRGDRSGIDREIPGEDIRAARVAVARDRGVRQDELARAHLVQRTRACDRADTGAAERDDRIGRGIAERGGLAEKIHRTGEGEIIGARLSDDERVVIESQTPADHMRRIRRRCATDRIRHVDHGVPADDEVVRQRERGVVQDVELRARVQRDRTRSGSTIAQADRQTARIDDDTAAEIIRAAQRSQLHETRAFLRDGSARIGDVINDAGEIDPLPRNRVVDDQVVAEENPGGDRVHPRQRGDIEPAVILGQQRRTAGHIERERAATRRDRVGRISEKIAQLKLPNDDRRGHVDHLIPRQVRRIQQRDVADRIWEARWQPVRRIVPGKRPRPGLIPSERGRIRRMRREQRRRGHREHGDGSGQKGGPPQFRARRFLFPPAVEIQRKAGGFHTGRLGRAVEAGGRRVCEGGSCFHGRASPCPQ